MRHSVYSRGGVGGGGGTDLSVCHFVCTTNPIRNGLGLGTLLRCDRCSDVQLPTYSVQQTDFMCIGRKGQQTAVQMQLCICKYQLICTYIVVFGVRLAVFFLLYIYINKKDTLSKTEIKNTLYNYLY